MIGWFGVETARVDLRQAIYKRLSHTSGSIDPSVADAVVDTVVLWTMREVDRRNRSEALDLRNRLTQARENAERHRTASRLAQKRATAAEQAYNRLVKRHG